MNAKAVFHNHNNCLDDIYIAEAASFLQLDSQIAEAFRDAAAIVREDATLLAIVAAVAQRLEAAPMEDFDRISDYIGEQLRKHSQHANHMMGSKDGMLAALLLLQMMPWTYRYYRKLTIPDAIFVHTMSDLSIWMVHHYREHGEWGVSNLGWLFNHLGGRLFRLGRLQFKLSRFPYAAVVFRHMHDGRLLALSEGGVSYRMDGRVDGTNGIYEEDRFKRIARFQAEDEGFTGLPINGEGLAHDEEAYLSASEWKPVLRRGDCALEVHIAEGSKLDHELCRASMEEAISFYSTYFPEQPFHVFVCTSWLLDAQLQAILPAQSNIVKFQRDFHLLPVKSDERETYERVFGSGTLDITKDQGDTSLRRAIIAHVESGRRLHGGGGFILRDELGSYAK
ncbi:acyltransferase domain-containing protein [Paenibacillus chungangensis]|uniref:Acyltransferase domain-containing protein n=1 Tax=Paenibacillus chungangensis TaxID=696535 RepID=A0ABW3HSA2_9BACL